MNEWATHFSDQKASGSPVKEWCNQNYHALPLERQSKAYRDNGINLATNTIANWLIKSANNYLSLLYDRLHELIYANHITHADETPVKVMRMARLPIKPMP